MQIKALYSVSDSSLTKLHRCIAYELAMQANQRGRVAIGLHELAGIVGVSYSTLHRTLGQLILAGYVDRLGTGRLQIVEDGKAMDEGAIDLPSIRPEEPVDPADKEARLQAYRRTQQERASPEVKRFVTMGRDGFPER